MIAVALHDVEPATFERVALIRDWLDDHGVARVTLLVVPAGDGHPFADRRPELADWLCERVRGGDAVAQQGFRQGLPADPAARPEFAGLDAREARTAVLAGRRLLHLAGVEPMGFVAAGYAYTPALAAALAPSYRWWAGMHRLWLDHGRSTRWTPALAGPWRLRAGARWGGPVLRVDIRPDDPDQPRRIGALEQVLIRARDRTSVTYDELALRA